MNETAEFILCIEGIPLITRFKTLPLDNKLENLQLRIEVIPLIKRFKTECTLHMFSSFS